VKLRKRVLTADGVRFPMNAFDRIYLVAVGKAALPMARELERILGEELQAGIAVTKTGHAGALRRCTVHEAGHPVPDQVGLRAAHDIRDLLRSLNRRDLVIMAVSGGASALLPCPTESITLADKQRTTALLLRAGADIYELNAVRKHLSDLKGGRLASLAYPATVLTLLVSDVIGDPVDVIGSGLTAPDRSTFSDAMAVLKKYGLLERVPRAVLDHLQMGARGKRAETPKPGDPIFENAYNIMICSNRQALKAASAKAKALGYRTLLLSSTLSGEAREVARVHAEILREIETSGQPIRPPACVLSGGETTVTVRGGGKGGRNQEFALSAAIAIEGMRRAVVLSVGTDGTDGPTDAAGAIATETTIVRAEKAGMEARSFLTNNDSYSFFANLGDLIKTGPTGTNVMDVHIMLAGARKS
jgi:hydroxypyruvate reductase